MNDKDKHFMYIFWFIVGLCLFGASFTVFLVVYLPEKVSERIADTALIFWLSTAVSGGIGYLIGSSAVQSKKNDTGTTITTPDGDNTKTTTTITNEPISPDTP